MGGGGGGVLFGGVNRQKQRGFWELDASTSTRDSLYYESEAAWVTLDIVKVF